MLISTAIEQAALAADMHDNFVDNPNWLHWFNAEYKQLLISILKMGYPYNITTQTITADGSASYDTSGTAIALIGVYKKDSNNRLTKLKYRNFTNRRSEGVYQTGDATEFYYKRAGNQTTSIYLHPTPSDGTYIVDYVAEPASFTSVSDQFYLPMGFEERIIVGMASRALMKEETVNSKLESLIKKADNYIESFVYDYLLAQQNTVLKVYPDDNSEPYFIFP